MPPLRLASKSFIGARDTNEDCLGVEQLDGRLCLAVGDGAGGHRNGETASRLAVQSVLEGFRRQPPNDARDLARLLLDAHGAVCAAQRAQGDEARAGAMSSTVVVLVLDLPRELAYWGHVGDSRLYFVDGAGAQCLTRDDSVVQALMDARVVTPERAAGHAMRNYLTAALGASEPIEPHVCARPRLIRDGDAYLLCSDGWWNAIDAKDIHRHLRAVGTPDEWLASMARQVAGSNDPRQDNFSAVGCWVGDPNDVTQAIPVQRINYRNWPS